MTGSVLGTGLRPLEMIVQVRIVHKLRTFLSFPFIRLSHNNKDSSVKGFFSKKCLMKCVGVTTAFYFPARLIKYSNNEFN